MERTCKTCAYVSVDDRCYNDAYLLKKIEEIEELEGEITDCKHWEDNPRSYPALYNPLKKTCRRCFHDRLKTEMIQEESKLFLCVKCNDKKLKGEFK